MNPLLPLFTFAQAQSLAVLPFVGTIPSGGLLPWAQFQGAAALGPAPGSAVPRQADMLVVVGQVSQKLAPILQRTHAKMAVPSWVVHVRPPLPARPSYAGVESLEEIIPVDVVIEGDPPDDETVARGLAALEDRVRGRVPREAT